MREAVKKVVAAFPGHPENCSPPSNTERCPAAFNIGTVHFFFSCGQQAVGQKLWGVLKPLQMRYFRMA